MSDTIFDGGVWINTPTMQGVLFVAKIGQGNVWYQSSDRHAQSGQFEWMVYNPADLAAVASGAKQQWQIQPEYEWTTPTLPFGPFDQAYGNGFSGDGNSNVGGVVFDPTTNRLYVLVDDAIANPYEAWPEMYVYQVGPAPSTTTVVVDDGQANFTTNGTNWTAAPNGFYGEQQQTNDSPPNDATATWQTNGLAPGTYTVRTTWNVASTTNTSAAVYQIYDGSTLVQTVSVDQQLTPFGTVIGGELFQTLATVQINSGTLRVVVTSQATGTLVADAIDYMPATVPSFGVYGASSGVTGAVQTFTALTGYPDQTVPPPGYTFDWDFGDGNTGTGETVNHIYSTAGTFDVELTLIAADGTTNYFYLVVSIVAG